MRSMKERIIKNLSQKKGLYAELNIAEIWLEVHSHTNKKSAVPRNRYSALFFSF